MKTIFTPDEKDRILMILQEETGQFVHLHQHLPIGRQAEDVIDNSLTRVQQIDPQISYVQVSDLYDDMMTEFHPKE